MSAIASFQPPEIPENPLQNIDCSPHVPNLTTAGIVSDKCPICFYSLECQILGTPDLCGHVFCLKCLLEWSKNNTTCPLDRHDYRAILVRNRLHGDVLTCLELSEIRVEPPGPEQAVFFGDLGEQITCGQWLTLLGFRESQPTVSPEDIVIELDPTFSHNNVQEAHATVRPFLAAVQAIEDQNPVQQYNLYNYIPRIRPARRPNQRDVQLFRNKRNKRPQTVGSVSMANCDNVLDTIMADQSKFHSRQSAMSLAEDGRVIVTNDRYGNTTRVVNTGESGGQCDNNNHGNNSGSDGNESNPDTQQPDLPLTTLDLVKSVLLPLYIEFRLTDKEYKYILRQAVLKLDYNWKNYSKAINQKSAEKGIRSLISKLLNKRQNIDVP